MLRINKEIFTLFKDKTFILTDFDHTLTTTNSETIWGLFSNNKYVDEQYKAECKHNFELFRKIELNPKINDNYKSKCMIEWFERHIYLFKKYQISKELLDLIIQTENDIILRKDTKDFLKNMYNLGIPVVIISSGFTYVIQEYLKKHDCYFDNIIIVSNDLIIKNGIIFDVKQPYLHSTNKDKFCLNFIDKKRQKGISFGDQLEDIKVGYNMDVYRVGFLNDHESQLNLFNSKFDITLMGESSFTDVASLLIDEYPGRQKSINKTNY